MPGPPLSDPDIIKKSYEEVVAQVFKIYWNECFLSQPKPADIPQIEARFQNGITNARKARDRAIALLPPQAEKNRK